MALVDVIKDLVNITDDAILVRIMNEASVAVVSILPKIILDEFSEDSADVVNGSGFALATMITREPVAVKRNNYLCMPIPNDMAHGALLQNLYTPSIFKPVYYVRGNKLYIKPDPTSVEVGVVTGFVLVAIVAGTTNFQIRILEPAFINMCVAYGFYNLYKISQASKTTDFTAVDTAIAALPDLSTKTITVSFPTLSYTAVTTALTAAKTNTDAADTAIDTAIGLLGDLSSKTISATFPTLSYTAVTAALTAAKSNVDSSYGDIDTVIAALSDLSTKTISASFPSILYTEVTDALSNAKIAIDAGVSGADNTISALSVAARLANDDLEEARETSNLATVEINRAGIELQKIINELNEYKTELEGESVDMELFYKRYLAELQTAQTLIQQMSGNALYIEIAGGELQKVINELNEYKTELEGESVDMKLFYERYISELQMIDRLIGQMSNNMIYVNIAGGELQKVASEISEYKAELEGQATDMKLFYERYVAELQAIDRMLSKVTLNNQDSTLYITSFEKYIKLAFESVQMYVNTRLGVTANATEEPANNS